MDDESILKLYEERSELAIEETSKKYHQYCSYISYHILNDFEDSKECVNDTFLCAWNSIPPNRPKQLSTYLGKITRNLSINRLKHNQTKKRGGGQVPIILSELSECIIGTSSVEETMDSKLLADTLNNFLYQLPDTKRKIFVMRYWYCLDIKEIALQLDASESKIKSTLHRLRKELKINLVKEGITI
jgi:RNA polymerase sigma-70 factor (ECF subfamily)